MLRRLRCARSVSSCRSRSCSCCALTRSVTSVVVPTTSTSSPLSEYEGGRSIGHTSGCHPGERAGTRSCTRLSGELPPGARCTPCCDPPDERVATRLRGSGGPCQRIEPPESIESFRPIENRCVGRNGAAQIQPFRVGDVERKGAAQIQPFRFGKISFAAPQPLFRLLVLGKVSAHTVIAYETSRLVEYRHPRDGQVSLAAVGCRPHDLEISERLVGIKGLAVLAPRRRRQARGKAFPSEFCRFR